MERDPDLPVDIVMILFLSLLIIVHVSYSCKSFQQPEMKNIYNYITAACIGTCLVIHIICFVSKIMYEVTNDSRINS